MTPKLSICIATRNRAPYIGAALDALLPQCRENVEIVVVDGASTDGTREVVSALQERSTCIRYVFKDKNGGIDRDFDHAVVEATGEYCWLMSDDDVMAPHAVATVLRYLDSDPSLLIVNSELRDSSLGSLIDPNRMRATEDRAYGSGDFQRLFEEMSGYLSYIGAVIIRRDVWTSRARAPYFGSFFVHVGVIFQERLPGITVAIAEPLITVRFGNTQWRPREFEIRMVRWTELIADLLAVEESVRWRTYRVAPWTSIKSLFFYRAKGTYDWDQYRKWVRPRVSGFHDRLRGASIALFPGVIANLIGLVFCSFSYRDSNVHFLDMKVSRFYVPNILESKRMPAKGRKG